MSYETGSVAGYISLGEVVVLSDAYRNLARDDFPRGEFKLFSGSTTRLVKGADGKWYVPLTADERRQFEQKAPPTLGTGVIEPQRIALVPQVTADDRFVLRDIMTVGRTNAGTVQYLREESYTRAAAPTAHGELKPEAAVSYTQQTAEVATLAVWMPVLVQQLADMGQLSTLIDGRLRYDVRKAEEEQVMYGDGATPNLEGILVVGGTHDIATADNRITNPTIIDSIRVGMTEVRVAGYEPNALAIHPIDWEDVVLNKGSDDHYLAQVFPDAEGNMRVWGLKVVETVAVEANAGVANEERNLVVGDFRRGSALLVREDVSVSTGMTGDQFIENRRTILAEERVAHPIFAPAAYAVLQTAASST